MGSEFRSMCSDVANSESPKVESAVAFFHGSGENLKHIASSLSSLTKYFHIDDEDCCLSTSCAEKDSRTFPCASILSDLECCNTCKHNHGNISLLSCLNAMEFFCQPFTELVTKARVQIFAEKEASFSSKTCHIQEAFHQFSNVFVITYR